MLRDAWLIFQKDLRIERRSKELLFSVLSYGVLATVLFALSFFVDQDRSRTYTPGILWTTILFAGSLALGRLFDAERESDCLGGLLMSPVHPRAIYLGKLLTWLFAMAVMELVTVPLLFLFFDVFALTDATGLLIVLAQMALGTLGFGIVGTLFAAMLLSSRLRDILVPIIVFPLVTPVLVSGVQGTRAALSGEAAIHWLSVLGAFDLIYLALALVLFPLMIRE